MKQTKLNTLRANHELLHMQIKAAILKEYPYADIKAGNPFPSKRELVKKFKASKVTIEKVFQELKKDGIIYSIPHVGTFWGKRQNLTIHKTIGVRLGVLSLSNITPDSYYFYMLQGIEEVLSRHGLHTKLLHYKSLDSTDSIRELGCDAVICTGTYKPVLAAVSDFTKMGIPYLLLDRPCGDENLNYLERDSAGNIEGIVDYLVSLGHRKICAAGKSPELWIDQKRYIGFETGMKKHHLDISSSLLQLSDCKYESLVYRNFIDTIRNHTALIILKNDMIKTIIEYCEKNDVIIPQECSIISLAAGITVIDGKSVTVHITEPYEMGQKAAEGIIGLLNNRIETPLHIEFPLKIIEGNTVAKV